MMVLPGCTVIHDMTDPPISTAAMLRADRKLENAFSMTEKYWFGFMTLLLPASANPNLKFQQKHWNPIIESTVEVVSRFDNSLVATYRNMKELLTDHL